MKSPWKRLLNIVERIDGTPCEDLVDCPDVLIDLNCWLMDHEELSARVADIAPELLYALKSLCTVVKAITYAEFDPAIERPTVTDAYLGALDVIAKAERKET